MCLPLLAPLGAALGATAGTAGAATLGTLTATQLALGAYTTYSQVEGQKREAEYRGAVARNNAALADAAAADAERIGFDAAQKKFRENAAFRGNQVAAAAANGVDISSGSTADILAATDYFGRIDVETVMGNARKQAAGLRQEAQNYLSESQFDNATAKASNPVISTGISLMTDAGNIADKWISRRKVA